MKRFMRSFLCIALLAAGIAQADNNDCCDSTNTSCVASPVRSIILPRNTGWNTARELIGWQDFIHLCDVCETYGALAFAFEYQRTFRPARIARQLFGPGTTNTGTTTATSPCNDSDEDFFLRFQGSNVPNRNNETSLIADNFGLSQNFDGTLRMRPRIDNFIADFEFYLGLDCWASGLYFRTHLPITHTRWTLFDTNGSDCPPGGTDNSLETINSTSQNTPFPACYMGTGQVTPATSILEALSGSFLFGQMQTEWKFGKFSRKRLDKTRLADIDLILGWDFLCTDCYHFGLYFQATAPTGNTPEAVNIFEPIAGPYGHWGVGGGLSGHATLWENDCDQNLSFWVEGNVQHLFSDTQTRSFDFKQQGPLSRYMLLKQFDSNGQYTGRLINAINFTTRNVETKFKVVGDASAKFAYRNCGFMADIGYNIYGRTCEEVKLCENQTGQQSGDTLDNTFGFKGCEGVCYFSLPTDGANPNLIGIGPENQLALNSTQSSATAFRCPPVVDHLRMVDNGVPVTGPVAANDVALTWDSVRAPGTAVGPTNAEVADGVIFAQQSIVDGTLTPARVSRNDINFLGATAQLTHKVFGLVGYTWFDCDFTPFISIFGEAEFAGNRESRDDCPTTTQTSTSSTSTTTNRTGDRSINQWGVGVKGGIAF